jgi:hypothetical protein
MYLEVIYMKHSKHLSVFRYLTMLLLVLVGMGAILFVIKGNVLAVGILALVAVAISLLWKFISTRCPACGRGFCMKVISREPLGDESVEVSENLNAWNAYDKAYHTGRVAVNATRQTYKETAKCRRCGHIATAIRTVDLKK